MKGFILSIKKAKNEDSIAIVLSDTQVRSYYRFFGARHSILQLGNLVDFEVEGEDGRFMPRLCSLSHMGFSWLMDKNKLLIWHNFIKKLEIHLRDADILEPFYYELLLRSAQRWDKQNPKRIICESYITLLQYEGRLPQKEYCFICEQRINEEISLMQGFKPVHPSCIYAPALASKKVFDFFESKKTVFFEDNEIEYLFSVVMKGL